MKQGQIERRLVEYGPSDDPRTVHPLWKYWLGHEVAKYPTIQDVTRFEMEQARLRARVHEIESASAKMRSEELADQEREDFDAQSSIAAIMTQLAEDKEELSQSGISSSPQAIFSSSSVTSTQSNRQKAAISKAGSLHSHTYHHVSNSKHKSSSQLEEDSLPARGSNLSFVNGKQVIPKEHKPYSPDPSKLEKMKQKREASANQFHRQTSKPSQPSSSSDHTHPSPSSSSSDFNPNKPQWSPSRHDDNML